MAATEIVKNLIVAFNDDGSFMSAMVELSDLNDDGRLSAKGRRVASQAELDTLMPESGAFIAQTQAMEAGRDAALEAQAIAEADKELAEADKVAIEAEKATADARIAELEGEKAALEASVEAKEPAAV